MTKGGCDLHNLLMCGRYRLSRRKEVPDRIPVILEPESYEIWLDPGMGVGTVSEMLKPCDARLMRCFPVSSRINSVVHDDAAGSARVEEMQNSLFS
jgi:putative SOS response-associated peptidase YedK